MVVDQTTTGRGVKMKRDILERPFDAHLIKTRRGHSGKSFSYVEGAEYIKRLNEAFDGMWSFEVVEHSVNDRDVVVIGRLVAGECTKIAFGGSMITTSHQTGEPLNLADDLKAAATDALKKAASLFGIGLHLYGSDNGQHDDSVVSLHGSKTKDSSPKKARKRSRAAKTANDATPNEDSNTLTERQFNAIMAIGRTLGWTTESLRQRAVESHGVAVKELSKADASAFIGELQQEIKSAA